jgi:hypothetical protein
MYGHSAGVMKSETSHSYSKKRDANVGEKFMLMGVKLMVLGEILIEWVTCYAYCIESLDFAGFLYNSDILCVDD